jgi:hypothetical protein
MVLFERAMMELSSLTASVTLWGVRIANYQGKSEEGDRTSAGWASSFS